MLQQFDRGDDRRAPHRRARCVARHREHADPPRAAAAARASAVSDRSAASISAVVPIGPRHPHRRPSRAERARRGPAPPSAACDKAVRANSSRMCAAAAPSRRSSAASSHADADRSPRRQTALVIGARASRARAVAAPISAPPLRARSRGSRNVQAMLRAAADSGLVGEIGCQHIGGCALAMLGGGLAAACALASGRRRRPRHSNK